MEAGEGEERAERGDMRKMRGIDVDKGIGRKLGEGRSKRENRESRKERE